MNGIKINNRQNKSIKEWLKWNSSGRNKPFRNPLIREIEIDITTVCSGLPSCLDECSYIHSRNLGYFMSAALADKIFKQSYELGFRRIIFSGGGEPLEPRNANFLEILHNASSKGFEVELLTNGKHLIAGILPKLIPHLSVLRISIPPVLNNYDHLEKIRPRIKECIEYRNSHKLTAKIIASLLIRSDTPIEEIQKDISILSKLNIDLIRFKPTHLIGPDNKRRVEIAAYGNFLKYLGSQSINNILAAKIYSNREFNNYKYPFCSYIDFNPFVIGADGKTYACCEHKYKPGYLMGDINKENMQEILERIHKTPFQIKDECFTGCKGDIGNTILSILLKAYDKYGDAVFENYESYSGLANCAITYLQRSNPRS